MYNKNCARVSVFAGATFPDLYILAVILLDCFVFNDGLIIQFVLYYLGRPLLYIQHLIVNFFNSMAFHQSMSINYNMNRQQSRFGQSDWKQSWHAMTYAIKLRAILSRDICAQQKYARVLRFKILESDVYICVQLARRVTIRIVICKMYRYVSCDVLAGVV